MTTLAPKPLMPARPGRAEAPLLALALQRYKPN